MMRWGRSNPALSFAKRPITAGYLSAYCQSARWGDRGRRVEGTGKAARSLAHALIREDAWGSLIGLSQRISEAS
jgi:hypothetical protein